MGFRRALKSIDLWIAKKMFFPPIVRACQFLNWDQYQFAGYATVVAMLMWVPVILTYGIVGQTLMFTITIAMIALIGWTGRLQSGPRGYWRAVAWFFMSFDTLAAVTGVGAVTGDRWRALAWFTMLWVEYAFMIDRIPPLETHEKADVRAAEALS